MTERKRSVTPADVVRAMTPAGGWTKATLVSWGIPWPPPKGWRKAIHENRLEEFLSEVREGREHPHKRTWLSEHYRLQAEFKGIIGDD